VDHDAAHRLLLGAYENGRARDYFQISILSPGFASLTKQLATPQDAFQRLGRMSETAMVWLIGAAPGSVRWKTDDVADIRYDFRVLNSFTNVPAHLPGLQLGTTHVAVGFLDLGNLAAACVELRQQWLAQRAAGDSSILALRWVGYDSSPYCVAKTMVVAHMIRTGADVDTVLQVLASITNGISPTGACNHVVMVGWHV
jgi:hypothetical protein